MNETWKKIFKDYIACHKAIGTLVTNKIISDDEEAQLRIVLLNDIIETMVSEVEK